MEERPQLRLIWNWGPADDKVADPAMDVVADPTDEVADPVDDKVADLADGVQIGARHFIDSPADLHVHDKANNKLADPNGSGLKMERCCFWHDIIGVHLVTIA